MTRHCAALLALLACATEADPKPAADTGEAEQPAMQQVFAYRTCDSAAPGELLPLPREVPADVDPVAAAMQEVVEGVADAERERGCTSFFSSHTAGSVRSVRRSSGRDTVAIDFRNFADALPDAPGVKSFLPPGVMAEVTWTIFHQFPEIDAVRFSFDGDERAFQEWLRGSGPAAVFTRRMWEQI